MIMPTKIRPANSIKVSNIAAVIKRKYFRMYTPYRITPNEEYYLVNGEKVSVSQFNILYPEISLLPIRNKGGNSDRTKNWLHDQKSF